jgi:ribosomal protein S27AE
MTASHTAPFRSISEPERLFATGSNARALSQADGDPAEPSEISTTHRLAAECPRCGERGGAWVAEVRPKAAMDPALLGLNQQVDGMELPGLSCLLYTHLCAELSAADEIPPARSGREEAGDEPRKGGDLRRQQSAEAQRDRLLAGLIFAAKDLARHGEDVQSCPKCQIVQQVASRLNHDPSCRTGRALSILRDLMLLELNTNRKETATDGDAGRADGIPRGVANVLMAGEECPNCGPVCFGGEAHNARVEDGVLYGTLPGELPAAAQNGGAR